MPPPPSSAASASWNDVCALADLEPFWAEAALIDGRQIAVVLLPGGEVHAVSNRDPVAGSQVMSRGIVGSRGDRATLASPLNKQVYDLVSGACLSSDGQSLEVFPVRMIDGRVEVALGAACDADVSGSSQAGDARVTTS